MTSLRVLRNDIELKCSYERKFVYIINDYLNRNLYKTIHIILIYTLLRIK